jgi:hypothetical protein
MMTPNQSAASLDVRGFHVKNPAARELLETVGRTFLTGYGFAAEARSAAHAAERLEGIPTRFRGFAYEGAAMAFAVLDGLPFGGRRVQRFVAGPAADHIYMAYVGVGWAMARLPRFRWRALYAADPLLRWLILDGYGFHQAYFHTQRYVHERYQETRFPWPADGPPGYATRVIDQGIGRAMWFVGGTDPTVVARLLNTFPEQRRGDLWAGAGLAATYAGGADEAELRLFQQHAGEYQGELAQGCVFGATARLRAGLVLAHNETATRVFCGMSVAEAAAMSDRERPERDDSQRQPSYETWRRRIINQFVSIER